MTAHAVRLFGVQPAAPPVRDPLFDAIVGACGYQPEDLTRDARGRLNKARKQLAEMQVGPDLVVKAAATFRKLYPLMTLSPQSLTANWPALMQAVRGQEQPPGTRMVDGKLERFMPGAGWIREV